MGNDGSWIKENIKRGGQGEWKDDLQGYLDLDGLFVSFALLFFFLKSNCLLTCANIFYM